MSGQGQSFIPAVFPALSNRLKLKIAQLKDEVNLKIPQIGTRTP